MQVFIIILHWARQKRLAQLKIEKVNIVVAEDPGNRVLLLCTGDISHVTLNVLTKTSGYNFSGELKGLSVKKFESQKV